MRGIIYTVTIISIAITTLSFDFNHSNHQMIFKNKMVDPTTSFVFFSIDGVAANVNRIKRLHFYYLDSLAHGQMINITTTGTKLIINTPTLIFEASGKQTPYLIYPGEKINIKYAGSDSLQMYIKGNPKRTNELNFFRKLVQKTGNIYYFLPTMPYQRKVNSVVSIHELEKNINKLKINRLQFLNSFKTQFTISDNLNKLAFKCIESTAILDSVLLYYNNRVLLTKQNIYVRLANEKIKAIKNMGFVPYPMYYVACIDLVSMATGTSPDKSTANNSADFMKRFNFIAKNFTGETKDFLLSNTVNTAHANKTSISKNYLDKFNSECVNKGYKDIINKRLNQDKMNYPKGSNMLLSVNGKTVSDLSTVILKNKGKITLLDFWASWCNPCREEIPYIKSIKKDYAGKNIAFITISTDSNPDDWQKANREESLGTDNNYLLLKADEATLVKRYHINSIPRYLLLGKDGKVISDDAPRPSDPKLKIMIDKCLSHNLQ